MPIASSTPLDVVCGGAQVGVAVEVRGEHRPGHVAGVSHVQAGLPELADEAGRTQRGGVRSWPA